MTPPKLAEPTTWLQVGSELTTASLLAALRAGRCFISTSPFGPQLYCRRVEEGITVRVVGANGETLEIVTGGETIAEHGIVEDDWQTTFLFPDGATYVRAQVIDDRGNVLAFANPVWSDELMPDHL